MPGGIGGEQAALCNRLAAYDIRTGKLKWHMGGPAGQYALRQPETFFLGPPLPLMGQLYVLAETKGEMRLLALDAATRQPALVAAIGRGRATASLQDPVRRWAGVSPSYADGVLVCPTSAGAIVGVDLATRSLLWGYCYGQGRAATAATSACAGACGGAVERRAGPTAGLASATAACWPRRRNPIPLLPEPDRRRRCSGNVRAKNDSVRGLRRPGQGGAGRAERRSAPCGWPTGSRPGTAARSRCPSTAPPAAADSTAATAYFLPLTSAEVVGIDLAAGKMARQLEVAEGERARKSGLPPGKDHFPGAGGV